MRGKNFILATLLFLFTNIIGFAVENPNSTTQESLIEAFDPDFAEGLKEYKPNLENIDKIFNYIEKNIKQKGKAIYYTKLDQEKEEIIGTDENNKIIYIEKLPEKLINSVSYLEGKETYSLKNGKTLGYSETNLETFGKRIKIKSEILRKNKINKKEAIEVLSLVGDINTPDKNIYSKIEYSNMEIFDENDNLILAIKYKNNKIIMEQEVEGNKVKMITYFENSDPSSGKIVVYENDILVRIMQIKNSIPEGEFKVYYPSGKLSYIMNAKNGVLNGIAKSFYENGKIRMIGHFKNGKKDGEFIEYDEDGSIIDKILYKNDEIVSQ